MRNLATIASQALGELELLDASAQAEELASRTLCSLDGEIEPWHFDELLKDCIQHPDNVVGLANPRFGEPSILVHETANWVFEVIYWYDMVSAIHEHSYPGAFLAVSGRRLHLEFSYSSHLEVDRSSRTTIGSLECTSLSILDSGAVTRIRPFEAFIHAVWPLDSPCLTAVIRRKAPRISRSYLPSTSLSVRFDERLAEAETIPRLPYLRSLRRLSGDRAFLTALISGTQSLSPAGLIYLAVALELRPEEIEESTWSELLDRRYGCDFALALREVCRTDALFRSLYRLKPAAISAHENAALAQLFFSQIIGHRNAECLQRLMESAQRRVVPLKRELITSI